MLPIFLVVLVDVFGLTLVIPLLAIYAEQLHASPLQATLLVTTYAIFQLISGPLLGRASDHVGRKPLLLVSQLGTLIGFLVMANAQSLWVLYLARVIDGATAGNLSLAQAYIADNTPPEKRAKSFALIGIAFGVGFFIGPWVTGLLSAHYGIRAPIFLAACMSALSIACTLFLLPHQKPAERPDAAPGPGGKRLGLLDWGAYGQYLARPVLGGLLFQFLAYMFCFALFTSGFALFAERSFTWADKPFGPREIGYLFAYSGGLGIVLQGGLIGRLVKRFGEPALVMTGFVALAIAYVGLGLVHAIPPLLAVTTVAAYGNGVLRPALTSLISGSAARHEQGVVLGLNQSLTSAAQIVAPVIAGTLIDAGQLFVWAVLAAASAGVGLLLSRWGSAKVAVAPRPAPGT
ncbi:MAG: MFS transporter [Deltaproteobacteria bacterium]|nr:MFS transporter [Deltaproteobacteria bacterium]